MIKESPRVPKIHEEIQDEYQIMEYDVPAETVSVENSPEVKTSYFFIELLVCSLLLWSLLFIKNTEFKTMIKNTLQEEIQNPIVQELIQEVEDTIKKVL